MSSHIRQGVDVIQKSTGRHGVILSLPPQSQGRPSWRVRFVGRPNNRGVPQGPKFNVDVDEDDLWVGVNSQQLTAADSLMKDAMRSISQAQRDSLLAQKEAERDNPASTDHEIFEAVRFVNAITEVNNE